MTRRNMATASPKKEWFCILPDKPNVLELRSKAKQGHYEGVGPLVAAGKLVAGGAMFESHPVEGEPALFKGSMIVYTGENVEEVRRIINNDTYAKSGVWDLEKAQIIPYVSAVREPMA
ncbi:hypothetical protein ASPWEDRAFT_26065 [Aspergillus wentii DTO 134E9]|uniref:YCII-related domain-containing protein n=1 Tax=Aspergillus wentii DTO 134E9 TaxID=1073089 RepID=A0A1L9RP37_ASPWE|nr:uncharacterized protein ASPWEDRAFT_26065 [Aspergillus wentii DTO 134E9]KAI9934252.1 hypothetical protein MW887_005326 [Aspergillus wentii]OJJ36608.1 hypothetical protein ASPWEDRAFT_26065 [Aspergillus wentii DTO 134E9]